MQKDMSFWDTIIPIIRYLFETEERARNSDASGDPNLMMWGNSQERFLALNAMQCTYFWSADSHTDT